MNPRNDQDQIVLSRLVGCWAGQLRYRKSADSPSWDVTGTAESRWVLAGKFVEVTLRAMICEQPWSAVFYVGFERGERRHVLVSLEPGDRQVTIRRGEWRHDRTRLVLSSRHRPAGIDEPCQSTTICEIGADGSIRFALTEETGGLGFVRFQATYRPAVVPALIGQPQPRAHRRFVIA